MYLHQNIVIESDKQRSAQSSVFYVKMTNDPSRQVILKVYKNDDIKSYTKELAVFNKLKQMKNNLPADLEDEVVGFPQMISNLQSEN